MDESSEDIYTHTHTHIICTIYTPHHIRFKQKKHLKFSFLQKNEHSGIQPKWNLKWLPYIFRKTMKQPASFLPFNLLNIC